MALLGRFISSTGILQHTSDRTLLFLDSLPIFALWTQSASQPAACCLEGLVAHSAKEQYRFRRCNSHSLQVPECLQHAIQIISLSHRQCHFSKLMHAKSMTQMRVVISMFIPPLESTLEDKVMHMAPWLYRSPLSWGTLNDSHQSQARHQSFPDSQALRMVSPANVSNFRLFFIFIFIRNTLLIHLKNVYIM